MAREIKFRAWDESDHTFILLTLHGCYDVGQLPLEQYTGLKDKNGKEIYEGDIVRHGVWQGIYQIQWSHAGHAFFTIASLCDPALEDKMTKGDAHDCTVIGNIHESKDYAGIANTLKRLRTEDDTGHSKGVETQRDDKCPICNGYGYFPGVFPGEGRRKCPDCNGTGKRVKCPRNGEPCTKECHAQHEGYCVIDEIDRPEGTGKKA